MGTRGPSGSRDVVDMIVDMLRRQCDDPHASELAAAIVSKLVCEEPEFRGRLFAALSQHIISADAGALIERLQGYVSLLEHRTRQAA